MSEPDRRPLKPGDVYPGHVLRDEFEMNAENRPHFKVNENEVPQSLRQLIPYVERWAIPCDVTRGDYFDQQPDKDIADFYHAVEPFADAIHAWLDEQPKRVEEWTPAAIHYMYCLKAHGEAYQPTAEEERGYEERLKAKQRKLKMKAAVKEAEEAFREKDYHRVVSLLDEFDGELDKIIAAKLTLARKKADT